MLRTTLSVVVAPEDDGELRCVTLRNDGTRARQIAVTSYAEIVLAPLRADIAHPGFSSLFIQTEFLPESGALLATRRPRSNREAPVWAIHVIAASGDGPADLQHETDRSRFLGRGRNARLPQAMEHGRALSNTAGNVLDPIFSLRTQVTVPPRGRVTVTYATFVTTSREHALALVAKYRTPALFGHVSETAWTFVRAVLYYLQSSLGEAMLFQTLASHLLVPTQQLRARRNPAGPYALDIHAPVALLDLRRSPHIADPLSQSGRSRLHPAVPACSGIPAHQAPGDRRGDPQRAATLLRAGPATGHRAYRACLHAAHSGR